MVIYTRNATCAPIRAEEGITGILTPPASTTSFRDLPQEEQIGGYPSAEQLAEADFDPATLDSEGRCVILEFPAFVLIGTYCPAERDETRTHFRTSFLRVLDARIRNLVSLGKRVVWTGDLNISREEIDTAAAEESMRKNGLDAVEWISTPARRMLNQLLVGGKVHGARDDGRETAILWDLCRAFNEGRRGMYTCWETKVNARPGNYGARIDYVICSHNIKDWFCDANIQEGLMGSDHCPVFAVLNDKVIVDGDTRHILDLLNPPGMFENGIRKHEWSSKNLLPTSGKLVQEFDKRRSIRDMFTQKPSLPKAESTTTEMDDSPVAMQPAVLPFTAATTTESTREEDTAFSATTSNTSTQPRPANWKRPMRSDTAPAAKRNKSQSTLNGTRKGQQSLRGFFAAKAPAPESIRDDLPTVDLVPSEDEGAMATGNSAAGVSPSRSIISFEGEATNFVSRQTWGKLFSKPVAPKCEHGEPCKTMLTKKPGVNCGRSFWMCNRPLGPSGKQEKGSQWRCHTFIWASDWDAREPG